MTQGNYIKVAGAALNQTPLDWRGNRKRIVAAIRQARAEGVQVLCLPELCISGYGCEDAFHAESVALQAREGLEEILPETEGIAVAVGLPVLHGRGLYNAAALLVDGHLAGLVAKQILAGYGVYYEPRWFKAWSAGVVERCRFGEREVAIGDLVFDLDGTTIGFEICEDAWGRGQAGSPGSRADVLLNPSASHFAFGKHETLRGIVVEGSRVAHGVYVFSNLLGNESGRLIYDGTVMIASNGRMVAENRRFSFREMALQSAIVDLRANRLERRRLSYPQSTGGEPHVVPVNFALAEAPLDSLRAERTEQERAQQDKGSSTAIAGLRGMVAPRNFSRNEEFAHAVSLGLWDYMRKSRGRGVVISLSGGVDSGSVAVLSAMMLRLALAELGWEQFRERLEYIGGWAGSGTSQPEDIPALLILTVYQSTANSGDVTRDAARKLATALGTRHRELEVEEFVRGYEALAQEALGRDISWENDDTARQNIQARVRSPGVWLLANLEDFLLLSTSNRSEIGVGYCTMDGDTSGGLAPIAGANKTFLRNWLEWVEKDSSAELGRIPALAAINRQAPTAELRPAGAGQTDEGDLMPYPVLDAIEQAAIRDRMAPVEVWRHLLATPLPGIDLDPAQAAIHVERFFVLWSRTQWKRERLAPSFHLDDENLDPKTWCRFPILSGGYELELEALRRAPNSGAAGASPAPKKAGSAAVRAPHLKRIK